MSFYRRLPVKEFLDILYAQIKRYVGRISLHADTLIDRWG